MSAEEIAQAKADALRSAASAFRQQYHARFTGTEVAAILEDAAEIGLRAVAAELVVDVPDDPVYTLQSVTDLLSLVAAEIPGDPITEAEVAKWEEQDVLDVVAWAGAVHLVASDNEDVEVPPIPEVLALREPVARVEVQPCPECRAGKHSNCDGSSWDFAKDEGAPCPCADTGHNEDEGDDQ